MKTLAIVATVLAVAGTASARNIEIPTGSVVPVCVENVGSGVAMFQAESLASKMFAAADVRIEWRPSNHCPANGIQIRMSHKTAESDHPKAYAYAMPVEGVHIVFFWDRIEQAAGQRNLPFLLAHVMVHEITHILEGVCRHSETGVLKAVFTREDIGQMEFRPLPFAPEDVELIHLGLRLREQAAAGASETATAH